MRGVKMAYTSRDQIPEQYRWDMSVLFPSIEEAQSELGKIDKQLKKLKKYQGRLLENQDTLREALKLYESISRRLHILGIYTHQSYDLDTRASDYQALYGQIQSLMARFGEATSWMTPEILASDTKQVKAMLKGDLKIYRQYFDDILRAKKHTLSDKEEALLAKLSESFQTPTNVFSLLNNADFEFPTIQDEDGNDLKLTHGNFIPTLQSKDRKVRQRAFKEYYSVFQDHSNTLAGLLSAEVKNNVTYARAKNFKSARAAALFENNIPESVYDALIEAVNAALPAMYKYQAIRKRKLRVKELHMYDVYVPLVKNVEMEIPYEEGKDMVLQALSVLGEDYTSVVKKAYDERWIDVYETPGKRSGAYSSGSFDTVPYMLLNHQDNLNDTFTLAHEMGHSMHSYYSAQSQPWIYSGYGIFLAEIASTFNEALLNNHLLNTITDKKQRLFIINHYLEGFKGTLFRQTMFAEFERDIHQVVEQGGSLTSETLNDMYGKLVAKYFGPDVIVDDEIKFEWSRIPHFYYNFYVFQYATGLSAATTFAKRVINQEDGALEKYKGFLKAGRSQYPMDVLKQAGLDMTDPAPIIEALETFSKLVDEFDELI